VRLGLYWYHTHPHGESYRQALDGMSGAIVIDGLDRYVPEVRSTKERILILRNAEPRPTILIRPSEKSSCNFMAHKTNGKAEAQPEWLDTVNVPAKGSVDLIMDFTDPIIRGTSLFHCHP
jgi:FtsP/CotA-like multicopper oxidase with cupredoxin domain